MHALKVLEFDAIRARLKDHCETTLGADAAEALTPEFEPEAVWRLIQETDEAHRLLADASPPSLAPVRDLREAFIRAGKGATLGGQELFQAAAALQAMRGMKSLLSGKREAHPLLWAEGKALPEAKTVEDAILRALEPDGEVKDAASTELSALRRKKSTTHSRIQEKINAYTAGKSRELLSDPIVTMRDGRYVVPVKAEYRGRVRGIVHDTSASGQTVFIEPEDVLQLGNALREIEAAEREEIARILAELSRKVGEIADEAGWGIEAAGRLDLAMAKARLGYEMKGTLPQPKGPRANPRDSSIEIEGGRHPLLDPQIAIPLDISIARGQNVLITGPNTGGKTVAIKTVGLFVLMAQAGLMPPARLVRLAPFKAVWADIGDEQSLQQSLSTFGSHIRNIAAALRGVGPGSLVLLDEVGAGTDPAEGAALAKAILAEIVERGGIVLASTHYGELKAFAFETEGFQNAAMEFDEQTLRPTFHLLPGAAGASHALKIAERHGIGRPIIERAKAALSQHHQDVSKMFESLDQAQKQARSSQVEAERLLQEAREKQARAERKLAEVDEIRRTAHARAEAEIADTLREIRLEAEKILEQLKQSADTGSQEKARRQLSALQESAVSLAGSLKPASRGGADIDKLEKGSQVRIEGYTQTGIIIEEPSSGEALVQMGRIKMKVRLESLERVGRSKGDISRPASSSKPSSQVRLQKAMHASTEITLRAMRAEEAMQELEKFIDDAVLAGLSSVRIVHGKGGGILRKSTQEHLRKNPNVASYRDGEPAEGGQGVTIATLK